ncbi:AT-hook motif nuclear-localized protein 28-like [Mangifera indica]|uniref:AT-hook motif nuclear-localized protein 28-like n=1 Tax=Mangifera indica TaxID=29780 RepID=UPI001CF93513|nr:AT-hook motif nuclear-localized protein 28-like [Mangifera indica]
MADYSRAISLSQPHSSSDDSSNHSPPRPPTSAASSSKTRTIHNTTTKITLIDQHHHIIQSPSDNAPRKPRGRPPGSKNKPKPPIVITKDTDSAMKPVVLEISAGADVIDHIIDFARRNQAGISVMSASGSVSNVTLRQPISHAPSLTLHGPFNLLSLLGSYLTSPSSGGASSSTSSLSSCCFGVTLAGAQGQVFGGIVAGKVTAASQVVVVAATFSNPSFHSLPISEEIEHNDHHQQHHQETKVSEPGSSAGKSMVVYGAAVASPTPLNCQMSPDVMHWGPPSRPPY